MARQKKELPRVSVVERRLAHPFGSPSVPITLKEGGPWAIRIVNANVRQGRIADVIYNKGWEFVEPKEIDGKPEELGFRVVDNRLVRGEHGEEVLVKMRQADFDLINRAKSEKNLKDMGVKATRELVANRAATEFGDEAADTVYNRFDQAITVSDERGAVQLDEADTNPQGA